MKLRHHLVLASVSLLFIACAGNGGSGGGSDPTAGNGGQKVVPAGYYDELMAQAIGDCSDIRNLRFQSLANLNVDQYGIGPDGKTLVVHILLNLRQDGTFRVTYSEERVINPDNDNLQFKPLFWKTIDGVWSLQDESLLILQNFGILTASENGGQKGAQLTIQVQIHDARLINYSLYLDKIETLIGPRGETPDQFCRYR